ncbi:hypothetical protein [Rhizobium sp. Root483D2]|uniref:hypothetical protein n=1 Tax=Rhizobium sp. Root483D2 TaxID=1736545 RepID=UPI0007135DCB|nr:hypothetical protein [Rhizobium sp. Root483D2]KQY31820.1 hypothetical protein ASD32_04320 [Rhizobium sp. Root483D2]
MPTRNEDAEMNIEPIRKIQGELAETGLGREIGATALTILSMGLSAVPIVGGPLSYMSDRVRSEVLDPDLVSHIKVIADTIESLAPDIAKIETLEMRVALLEHFSQSNQAVAAAIKDMIEKVVTGGGLDPIFIESNGGITNFTDNVVSNMHLHSVASEGGQTLIERVSVSGSAKFETKADSIHNIKNSIFSGGNSKFRATSYMDNAIIHPGATVETSPFGQNTGVKVTFDAQNGGTGMTISGNGIEFGKKR